MNKPQRQGFLSAALTGIIVGLIVAIIAYIIGALPHLTFLRTYSDPIGIVVGLITFVSRWLGTDI